MPKKILILDHNREINLIFKQLTVESGFDLIFTQDTQELTGLLRKQPFDVILVHRAVFSGVQKSTLRQMTTHFPNEIPVVIEIEPSDFATGKLTADFIKNLIKSPVNNPSHAEPYDTQPRDLAEDEMLSLPEFTRLIGESKTIRLIKKDIIKIAPMESTVLLLGETGTGKELVARMIHAASPNRHRNFIPVHCGGIPDTLLESTLFGHEKGAFTNAYRTHKGYFEVATHGTIFLDEIGDTTASMQVKLLRVLQDKTFQRVGGNEVLTTGARIVAATHRDLMKMVQHNQFRQDLYYRLNVLTIKIAPLRERAEDILPLVRYYLQYYSKKLNRLGVYLKPETLALLQQQPWLGNVRELENVIARLVALSDSDWIGPEDLPQEYRDSGESFFPNDAFLLPLTEAKQQFERAYIARLLKIVQGNISHAARIAQVPRQNLHVKIKKYGIQTRTIILGNDVDEEDADHSIGKLP